MNDTHPVSTVSDELIAVCKRHNVSPVEERAYSMINKDMAWEIFDFNLNEVFRSDLIYSLGNYSKEAFKKHSPWELYKRPRASLEQLIQTTQKLHNSQSLVEMKMLPSYIIEEKLTAEKAQFEIAHQFACPLFCNVSKYNVMILSAFYVRKLDPALRVPII